MSIDAFDVKGIKIGDKLKFRVEIVSIGGVILYEVGEKVTIREIDTIGGHCSRGYDPYWVAKQIIGFKIKEGEGTYSVDCFEKI